MTPADFAFLDLLIVGTAAVSVLVGAVRGFVREALSLALWVGAFVIASLSAREASTLFESWVRDPALRTPLGFGAVFLAALILGSLATRLLGMIVDMTGLTGIDRTLGTVFGGARAFVLLVVITAFAAPLFADTGWWQASRLVPLLVAAQADIFGLFDRIAATIGELLGGAG